MATRPVKKTSLIAITMPDMVVGILGPPPAVTTEDLATHELAMSAYATAINGPLDAIDWKFVRDLADVSLVIQKLRFLQARVIEPITKAPVSFQPAQTRQIAPRGTEGLSMIAAGLTVYEQIERLLSAAERKFENTLKAIDAYRHGVGERLREALNAVIEGECTVEPGGLVPEEPAHGRAGDARDSRGDAGGGADGGGAGSASSNEAAATSPNSEPDR